MRTTRTIERLRHGEYRAEVEIEWHEYEEPWSSTRSLDDVRKLECVRKALQAADTRKAARSAGIYHLTRVQPPGSDTDAASLSGCQMQGDFRTIHWTR